MVDNTIRLNINVILNKFGEPKPEMAEVQTDFEIKWFEQNQFTPLYGKAEFSNALCSFGTKLVQLLKNETLNRGAIPFYGTSLSNLHSWNIAINAGFYPAWVEIATIENCTENGGIL